MSYFLAYLRRPNTSTCRARRVRRRHCAPGCVVFHVHIVMCCCLPISSADCDVVVIVLVPAGCTCSVRKGGLLPVVVCGVGAASSLGWCRSSSLWCWSVSVRSCVEVGVSWVGWGGARGEAWGELPLSVACQRPRICSRTPTSTSSSSATKVFGVRQIPCQSIVKRWQTVMLAIVRRHRRALELRCGDPASR